jgi:hypothetical protein
VRKRGIRRLEAEKGLRLEATGLRTKRRREEETKRRRDEETKRRRDEETKKSRAGSLWPCNV